jgi:23S rRNA (guanosine2251-2'-O)-methyltransferase
LKKIKTKKALGNTGEWLYGVHSVREAVYAGRREVFQVHWTKTSPKDSDFLAYCRKVGVKCQEVSESEFNRSLPKSAGSAFIPVAATGNIAARVNSYPYRALDALVEESLGKGVFFACDQIQDPQNLGALIRSHYALGGQGILLPRDGTVHVTPRVCHSSAGLVERTSISLVTNLARALEDLKKLGFWIVVANMQGSLEQKFEGNQGLRGLEDLPDPPMVIVLGHEGRGIRPGIRKKADLELAIPMKKGVDSLNVSVSGAIFLYELFRQGKISP